MREKNHSLPGHGEESIQQFLWEIREYPKLSQEEEASLAEQCVKGDAVAIRKMVNSNLRLVVSIAKQYTGRGVSFQDLVQEGSIGLLIAAQKFDISRKLRFSTYASKWIRQKIQRCLVDHGSQIRLPHYTAEQIQKIITAQRKLLQTLHREPSVQEISEHTGFSEEKVFDLLHKNPDILSLDMTADIPGSVSDMECLGEETISSLDEKLIQEELVKAMDSLLSLLEPRQQQLLRLRYGLIDNKCHSYAEIASMLGISKERARQIQQQALEKLQKYGTNLGLEDFLNA